MTAGVLLAVLLAAFLHASWNALIKVGASRIGGMVVLSIVQGGVGLAVAAGRPWPVPEAWPWLAASGVVHAAYKFFLSFAYEHGDLSRVYPIARGAAPMLVMLASLAFLPDPVATREYLGIALIGFGILALARGAILRGESRRLIPFALASALTTATYSIVDGLGARVLGDAAAFVAWLFVFDAVLFVGGMVALRGRAVVPRTGRAWAGGAAAALASYAAYAIAVWAMTVAPIALVTALRETSILFAVLIGWLALGEPMDRAKGVAALLMVAGVVLMRL